MRNKYISLILTIFFIYTSFAQNKIDSLKSVLNQTVNTDTNRINILNNISSEFSRNNPDSSLIYAKKALSLGETVNFRIGILQAYKNIATSYYCLNIKLQEILLDYILMKLVSKQILFNFKIMI